LNQDNESFSPCLTPVKRWERSENRLWLQAQDFIFLCLFFIKSYLSIFSIKGKAFLCYQSFRFLTIIFFPFYFGWGDRTLNSIHSSLNADLHLVNLMPNPGCICGHGFEDCIHFFFEYPFYNENRAILSNKVEKGRRTFW
jgi:hypothetical protein